MPGGLPKVEVASGGMQVSPILRVLCSSKLNDFPLGSRQSPVLWLRSPNTEELGAQPLGMKTENQPRVKVRTSSMADPICWH